MCGGGHLSAGIVRQCGRDALVMAPNMPNTLTGCNRADSAPRNPGKS